MTITRSLLVGVVTAALTLGSAVAATATGQPLGADLDAANEVGVAAPGDEGTTGTAALTFNQGRGEICFDIDVDGNDAPIVAAHIHAGTADVNGPVVVNFDVPANGLEGCVDGLDKDLVKQIRKDPGAYYVNVHNAVSPAGAARGQLG